MSHFRESQQSAEIVCFCQQKENFQVSGTKAKKTASNPVKDVLWIQQRLEELLEKTAAVSICCFGGVKKVSEIYIILAVKGFGLRVPFACPELSSGQSQTGLEPPLRDGRGRVLTFSTGFFFMPSSREAVSREKSLKSANEKRNLRWTVVIIS